MSRGEGRAGPGAQRPRPGAALARWAAGWRRRPPPRAWVRVRPHLWPAAFAASAAVLVHAAFPASPVADVLALEEGMVAREDVIAAISFPVYKTEAELLRERTEAAAAVPPTFVLDLAAADSALARVAAFFAAVDSLAAAAPDPEARRRAAVAAARRAGLELAAPEQLHVLADPTSRRALRRAVERALRELLVRGYTTSTELSGVTAARVLVRGPRGERFVPRDSVLTTGRLYEAAAARVPETFSPPALQLHQALVVRFAEPTLRFDEATTRAAREQARAAVNPAKGEVLANERIIRAHERVTAEDLARLRAYRAALAERGLAPAGRVFPARVAGSLLLNLVVLVLLGLAIRFHRPDLYGDAKRLGVVWALLLVVTVAAGAAARAEAPPELVPVALLGIALAVLYGAPLALGAVAAAAVLVAARPPFLGVSALLTLTVAGAVGALGVRVVRRRMQILGCAATVTAGYALAALCLGLLHGTPLRDVATTTALGAGNAAVSASLAFVVFLPILEKVTGVTTDLTLLELADLNRPLLRRLALEAPGTYAHSVNVANLAEAAAHAVGADALLTRVGVYYHDIGKLRRPEYFVENQRGGPNPHERLRPEVSAAVVREHVLEGLRLAREAGLPDSVRAFIAEHHGTARIGFFYEKACEQDPRAVRDDAPFRYPGPKPRSKETAIVMLADAVESAARALQDPTPDRIRELVDRVVARKIEEGQLDEAPLTLRDLDAIKERFATLLSGVYHRRVDYPLTAEMAARGPGRPRAADTA